MFKKRVPNLRKKRKGLDKKRQPFTFPVFLKLEDEESPIKKSVLRQTKILQSTKDKITEEQPMPTPVILRLTRDLR